MCPECDLPLVEHDPGVLGTASPEHAHVEYELDDWSGDARLLLDRLLAGVPVPHVWQGGRLVVPEAQEEAVDLLVEQVVATVEAPWPFAEDEEVVAFLIDDLDDDALHELVAGLDAAGIEHATSGSELVTRAADAETVDGLLDELDHPDALDPDGPDPADRSGDDGADELDDSDLVDIDPDAVLGGLFVAADRLQSSARDSKGVLGTVDAADALEHGRRPFGFEASAWRTVVTEAVALRGLLESEEATDEDIEDAAAALRTRLREIV
jgi:hypothetical protein